MRERIWMLGSWNLKKKMEVTFGKKKQKTIKKENFY